MLFAAMLLFPLAIYLPIHYISLPAGHIFEFDWGEHEGVFVYLHMAYRLIFGTIFILGLAGWIFFADQQAPLPATAFFCAALQAFLFLSWLTFQYESYLHVKWKVGGGQSNYTTTKYAITLALGFSSAILFVYGLIAAFLTIS